MKLREMEREAGLGGIGAVMVKWYEMYINFFSLFLKKKILPLGPPPLLLEREEERGRRGQGEDRMLRSRCSA